VSGGGGRNSVVGLDPALLAASEGGKDYGGRKAKIWQVGESVGIVAQLRTWRSPEARGVLRAR
tara:strand:- start:294 stop:482 length:189 start_codon:yes stop_codon:yes gene_type:complete